MRLGEPFPPNYPLLRWWANPYAFQKWRCSYLAFMERNTLYATLLPGGNPFNN